MYTYKCMHIHRYNVNILYFLRERFGEIKNNNLKKCNNNIQSKVNKKKQKRKYTVDTLLKIHNAGSHETVQLFIWQTFCHDEI